MSLICHSCQELVSTEGYYDAKYQPICYLCQAEWPEVTPLAAIDVAVKPDSVNNQTQTALDTYLNKYQVFLNQQANVELD